MFNVSSLRSQQLIFEKWFISSGVGVVKKVNFVLQQRPHVGWKLVGTPFPCPPDDTETTGHVESGIQRKQLAAENF